MLQRTTSRFGPFTPRLSSSAGAASPESGALAADAICVSCRRPSDTPYCPHCGERRAGDRPLHVRELFEELWGTFVSIDGRVVRTFWTLFRRPGALTAAYVRGERRGYLTPLKLFLTTNVLFFLAVTRASATSALTTPLDGYLDDASSGAMHALVRHLVDGRVAQRHLALTAYAQQFNAAAATYTHTLILALAPVFAGAVALITLPRRRPLVQHVAFALHALSLMMLLAMGLFYAIYYTLLYGAPAVVRAARLLAIGPARGAPVTIAIRVDDGVVLPIAGVLLTVWLAVAIRRNYGGGLVGAAARAVALLGCVVPMLEAYRAALFFFTYWVT